MNSNARLQRAHCIRVWVAQQGQQHDGGREGIPGQGAERDGERGARRRLNESESWQLWSLFCTRLPTLTLLAQSHQTMQVLHQGKCNYKNKGELWKNTWEIFFVPLQRRCVSDCGFIFFSKKKLKLWEKNPRIKCWKYPLLMRKESVNWISHCLNYYIFIVIIPFIKGQAYVFYRCG